MADSRLNGLASADTVAALRAAVQNEKVQRAIRTREMAKILGQPPEQMTDDMLAGGNITINPQPVQTKSGIGPWIFASVLVVVVALLGWAVVSQRLPTPSTNSPTQPFVPPDKGKSGLDLQVIPPDPPLMQ